MIYSNLFLIAVSFLVVTVVSQQTGPNFQLFSEREFGQRAPQVVRSTSDNSRFSVVVFGQVRATTTNLQSALAKSCDAYLNLCFVGGRRHTNRAWNRCSASAQRCRNSIQESVRRAGSLPGVPASSTLNVATTAAQRVSTTASASRENATPSPSTQTTGSALSPAVPSSTATASSTANNLVEPTSASSSAATTVTSTISGTSSTRAATATANLAIPTQAAEVAPPPLAVPNMSQFCAQVGQANTLADGTQKRTSTCSQTAQGQIPSFERMVSTLIVQPENGATIQRGSAVAFACTTSNMETGFFDDPQRLYYATPQTLNAQGVIQGHQHISVQRIASGVAAPDPRSEALAFFVGLNTRADAQGVHTATIPANTFTQPGVYRICTITGTRGHQPVIMPVARRGSQDDCIRVTVG